MADVPTLTAGLAGQPTDTTVPTSAVVNVVWAMSYPVQQSSPGLSTGALAGIAIGAVGAVAIMASLGFWGLAHQAQEQAAPGRRCWR